MASGQEGLREDTEVKKETSELLTQACPHVWHHVMVLVSYRSFICPFLFSFIHSFSKHLTEHCDWRVDRHLGDKDDAVPALHHKDCYCSIWSVQETYARVFRAASPVWPQEGSERKQHLRRSWYLERKVINWKTGDGSCESLFHSVTLNPAVWQALCYLWLLSWNYSGNYDSVAKAEVGDQEGDIEKARHCSFTGYQGKNR